ncbi:MAG: DUF4139 domain-containing protein [Polyangiaceae bacterium]
MREGRRTLRLVAGLTAIAGAMGLLSAHGSSARGAPATPSKASTAADRKDVSITVYNQNFGLVRETRALELGTGKVSLDVGDVASTIQPETVAIRSLAKDGLSVLEQNYRYDLLTPATLLDKYVGKKLRVYRYNEQQGKEEGFDATLVSFAGGEPILDIGGELTFDFKGRLGFPGVPANLIANPTLVWLLDSKQPKQDVEVTYLAQNMNWSADYVMVVDDADATAGLTGWVTLTNQSGASYKGASLKLVAGDVNRIRASAGERERWDGDLKKDAAGGFQEEALFEYHMYTLDRATDVLDNEQKQVTLLEADKVSVTKKLLFFGQEYWYRGEYGQVMSNQKVGVYLDLLNDQASGLGMPLPKGTVRVYKADKSGSRQFVGEDRIDHTPKDERVRIKMGDAFDVVGDRKQTNYKVLGKCTIETAWEIELRNHKDTAVHVEDYEPIGGDWEIVESSQPSTKKDAATFTFDVEVPANGKKTVTYRARVKVC